MTRTVNVCDGCLAGVSACLFWSGLAAGGNVILS